MRVSKSAVLALVAFTLGALPAGAQDAQTVEVTPYLGLGTAGASPVGVAVTSTLANDRGARLSNAFPLLSRRRTLRASSVSTPMECHQRAA
jgi:hypothetical protein